MKTYNLENSTILISRTDSIGDVVLTIPICLWLKKQFPSCKIVFLANAYTHPVLACFPAIDKILHWKEIETLSETEQIEAFKAIQADYCLHVFPKKEIAKLAKKAKIPVRIGTSHRLFHLLTCNVRLNFTRKNSDFHEAQLNFELFRPFGLQELPKLEEISQGINEQFSVPCVTIPAPFDTLQEAIILHPKSQGSALEWPIEKYIALAENLLQADKKVVFSGTEKEGELFRAKIPVHPNCFDATGKMSLSEFIAFIAKSKSLVACSTGPLHIAGISGIQAVGLFSSRRPIHPGRWKALGKNVNILEYDKNCVTCGQGKKCSCLTNISVEKVQSILLQ